MKFRALLSLVLFSFVLSGCVGVKFADETHYCPVYFLNISWMREVWGRRPALCIESCDPWQ